MPKTITSRKLIAILIRNGFVLQRTRGSHHLFQHPLTKRRALVPLHAKDIPKGTLHDILKQSGIAVEKIT